MPVKPGYLLLAGGGAVILWSGIKGKSATGVFRELIGGQDPNNAASANQIAQETVTNPSSLSGLGLGAGTSGTGTGITGGTAVIGQGGGGNPAQNQALAKMLAMAMGHGDWTTGAQWNDWLQLWNRESGWNQTADTRVTHAGGDNANSAVFAYGVAQARPYSKYPRAGWPPDKGGSSDPRSQITWGIGYILSLYGSPSGAWQHELSHGWY